jgi:hypothetical protein
MGGWWGAEDWKTEKAFLPFGEDRQRGGTSGWRLKKKEVKVLCG